MNSREIRTILLISSLISGVLLYVTADVKYNSLSAFVKSENVIFYNAMHMFASWFFMLNAAKTNNKLDYMVSISIGSVLMVDMYNHLIAHNILAALTLLLACFNIVHNSYKKRKIFNIALSIFSITIFLVSFYTNFHFLKAELLSMFCISFTMIRRMWFKPKNNI